jgi:hypothetical protein
MMMSEMISMSRLILMKNATILRSFGMMSWEADRDKELAVTQQDRDPVQ